MNNDFIVEYNKLVPLMNKLSYDNLDIWEHHSNVEGYGFKVIFKNSFIEVSIDIDFTSKKVTYYLNHYEKWNNVLSCLGKCYKSSKVYNIKDIEKFIREIAKSEKGNK